MTLLRSRTENGIPLYTIPHDIAHLINERGEDVLLISRKRTLRHYYNISIRTKSLPKELRLQIPRISLSSDNSVNNNDDLIRERYFVGDPE
jgi:hypothetical protein